MEEAKIETYIGGFSVKQLNLNKAGLKRLREGLNQAEKDGFGLVEDESDTSIEITLCSEPEKVEKKKYKKTILSIWLALLSWSIALALMFLGLLYLKEILTDG